MAFIAFRNQFRIGNLQSGCPSQGIDSSDSIPDWTAAGKVECRARRVRCPHLADHLSLIVRDGVRPGTDAGRGATVFVQQLRRRAVIYPFGAVQRRR